MTRLCWRRLNKHTRLGQNRQGTWDRPWGKAGSWPRGGRTPIFGSDTAALCETVNWEPDARPSVKSHSQKMETGGGAGILVDGKITESSWITKFQCLKRICMHIEIVPLCPIFSSRQIRLDAQIRRGGIVAERQGGPKFLWPAGTRELPVKVNVKRRKQRSITIFGHRPRNNSLDIWA